jgi:hypothetical protein
MFFFTGVAFAGVVALLVAEFAVDLAGLAVVFVGAGPGVDFTVLAGFVAAGVPVPPSFLGVFFTGVAAVPAVLVAAGVTFVVAAVPVVAAGFEALLTACFPVEAAGVAVFLRGVAAFVEGAVVTGFVSAAAAAFRTGSFFCVPSGVLGLGVTVFGAAFFTGGMGVVFDAADGVALAGVVLTGFFVAGVLPAVLAMLLTLAGPSGQPLDAMLLLGTYTASRQSAS